MNDNSICIINDSESSISFTAGIRVASDSRSPSLTHDYTSHKVVSLTDDYDPERISRNSLDERASSLDYFEALFLDEDGEDDHTKVPMPPPVLTDAKIQVVKRMREYANDFDKVY